MVMLSQGISARYNLGPVKPWVETAAYFLGPRHNIKTIGGWRASDPFPDHPSGHALDFMITTKQQGDELASDAIANAQALGVKYIIWNRQTWNPQEGWQPYTSTSNPHTDHVHITFNDQPGTGEPNATPAGYQLASVDDACAMKLSIPLKGETCLLSKDAVRSLLGLSLIGAAIVVGLVGVVVLVAYGLKATPIKSTLRVVPGANRAVRSVE